MLSTEFPTQLATFKYFYKYAIEFDEINSSKLLKEMSLLLWFGMVNFLSPNERLPETVAIFEGITKVI